jgi:hypothetical protein
MSLLQIQMSNSLSAVARKTNREVAMFLTRETVKELATHFSFGASSLM